MLNPIIIYGEPISKHFFYNLLVDKNSKYLTDFKRYFNFLKKNSDDYKNISIKDKVSIDKPLLDYVLVINDWLKLETNNMFTIYIDRNENLFFGFSIPNPAKGDIICKIVKDWNKFKKVRNLYYEWISIFDDNAEGPIYFALY
jgi:hypothetical protein